jgi:hypothetical protein
MMKAYSMSVNFIEKSGLLPKLLFGIVRALLLGAGIFPALALWAKIV